MMTYLDWKGKLAFFMGASIYCLVTFWLFWPYTPIEIHDITIINSDKTVYTNELLVYQVTYSKLKIYPVISVARQLVNNHIIPLSPVLKSSIPCGENRIVYVQVRIPENIPPDKYVLRIVITYQVNPIRVITVMAQSNNFEVKKI